MQNGKKIIFVSFEPGTRGHYIARVIACLPDVYWYSHKDNGIRPWNLFRAKQSTIRQRHAFPNHFDRLVPNGKLPPTWDYLKDYIRDEKSYYENIFYPQFLRLSDNIDKTLVYCTHSQPDQLLKYFDNCRILNVVESADTVVNKYVRTTALFPGWTRFAGIVEEDNHHLVKLKEYKQKTPSLKVRDVWAYDRYNTAYRDQMANEYQHWLLEKYRVKVDHRNQQFKNTINIRMHPDWRTVKDFLAKWK